MRPIWTMMLAILIGLILTGLIDAAWYTSDHGGAFLLAAATLVLVIGLLISARGRRPEIPRIYELIVVALVGLVLTTLFWFRARAGLSSGWLSGIELTILAMFAWAWPALLLVVFYRRSGEGWRPDNRRRFVWLTGTALLAGAFGWVFHLILWDGYESAGYWQQAEKPMAVHNIITRPTETPIAIGALGGPRSLQARPAGIIAEHPGEPDRLPIELELTGTIFPGFTRDLSWQVQGTQVESSNPRVITASTNEQGRWQLHPHLPGPAIISIKNRRAKTHIGVWVTNRYGDYPPFEVVSEQFSIKPVSAVKREGEIFHRQTLRLRNDSDHPVLGPIYAVFHTHDQSRVVFGDSRRTARIEPAGLPWVQALGPTPGNQAPVIAAGESVDFEILVIPELTTEWLHCNVDLIQAFGAL